MMIHLCVYLSVARVQYSDMKSIRPKETQESVINLDPRMPEIPTSLPASSISLMALLLIYVTAALPIRSTKAPRPEIDMLAQTINIWTLFRNRTTTARLTRKVNPVRPLASAKRTSKARSASLALSTAFWTESGIGS
ncbi:hypothetical protein RRF57_000508 [Xylaria bambusicola]|uniref:Uncharacterized protein n=1 Tax=Xylaria bambusicola TaxID=326684 RepID=A0AAN7UCC1_9PEZI